MVLGLFPFFLRCSTLNINKPDLMIWLFWITQNTVYVKHLLLHSPGWDFLSSHFHLMRCPNPPHHQEPQNAIFPIPKGWSWHVCAAEKKKISPQHTNPSLKQCKSSFSLYGSPLIFHTSANSGQGWTDLRKGLGVLWKSLQVQSCVCI